ncbi:MAG TPA: YbaK/EbsC family protein [Acidimicrobiales bacterium]|nr:YbaK/EbsC family protein [Acidimicrobiales bacterium]
MSELAGGEARVAEELNRLGIAGEVRVMPASTRSAAEAAAAVGCDVSQIVKSLIFRSINGDSPILVLTSGANRVDEGRLAEIVGGPVERATAEFVRARTGYAIGGVPPIGHLQTIDAYLDEHLLAHPVVWAAAGSPRAVFAVTPAELVRVTAAKVVALAAT